MNLTELEEALQSRVENESARILRHQQPKTLVAEGIPAFMREGPAGTQPRIIRVASRPYAAFSATQSPVHPDDSTLRGKVMEVQKRVSKEEQ